MTGELLRRWDTSLGRRLAVALLLLPVALGVAACGGGSGTLGAKATCTIIAEVGDQTVGRYNGRAFVSEQTQPDFASFRAMAGPLGNPTLPINSTGVPDTYAVSEVWQRIPGSPVVFRGEVTPQTRTPSDGIPDSFGSGWTIQSQNATGAWSGSLGFGSAHNGGDELDTPETGAYYVPQLMTVGVANPQVFACAGIRTADARARTTYLLEAIAPKPATGLGGSAPRIQDLLYGDRYFVPLPTAPLAPPPPQTPPTPAVGGAGDSTKWGEVTQCAMRQVEDDLTTRELHMILVANGHLYHSVASTWGTATDGNGNPFPRFGTVSSWTDVEQTLGVNYGPISSAAIVAKPAGISLFFTAAAGGVYRIWHTQRRSSDGAWQPAKDVLALTGDARPEPPTPSTLPPVAAPNSAPAHGTNQPPRPSSPCGVVQLRKRSSSYEAVRTGAPTRHGVGYRSAR